MSFSSPRGSQAAYEYSGLIYPRFVPISAYKTAERVACRFVYVYTSVHPSFSSLLDHTPAELRVLSVSIFFISVSTGGVIVGYRLSRTSGCPSDCPYVAAV